MKKNLFGWLVMTAVLVGTGCSTDEVVNDFSEGNAIQFGTYVGRNPQARATVITTDGNNTTDGLASTALTSFGVFAYYTGQNIFADALASQEDQASPNFMYNQEVKKNTDQTPNESAVISGWNYSPVKYWPNNDKDKISFFAYAPHNSNCAKGDNDANLFSMGLPKVKFEVANVVKDQIDFLYATPVVNQTKQDVTENVIFTFNHALSRIGFQVQAMVDRVNPDQEKTETNTSNDGLDNDNSGNGDILKSETTILVKKVTLTGKFITTGELTYSEANSATSSESYTAAVTGTASSTDVTYTLSATSESDSNFKTTETVNKGTLGEDGKYPYSVVGQTVTNTEAALNADDSFIMVIPEDFTNKDLTITVEYDVITVDQNLSLGYSLVKNAVSSTFRGVNFEAGKAYTFSLHLGMTSVKLSASVNGWAEGTDYVVNVPLNKTTATTP